MADQPVFTSPILERLKNTPVPSPPPPPPAPANTVASSSQAPPTSPAQGALPPPPSNPVPSPVSASATPTAIPSEKPASPAAAGSSGAPPTKAKVASVGGWKEWLTFPRLLVPVAVVLALIGAAVFALMPKTKPVAKIAPGSTKTATPSASINLTYWGLWEPAEVMSPLLREYEKLNPQVKITYEQQRSTQYRQRLQAAIDQGAGPDIYRFHHTWMPMLDEQLAPAPNAVLPPATFNQDVYPILAEKLVRPDGVKGVPLMFDGLALVYNQTMLEAANAAAPTTWADVRSLANVLTVRTGDRIERGGVALGLTGNVEHFSDIFGLFLLQSGANPASPTEPAAIAALEFFTSFARGDQPVWDATLPNSTLAMAQEKVAMILVPSWRVLEILDLNPNLRLGVARVPQLTDEKVSWASVWVEGVSVKSKQQQEAWKLLVWLSQPEQLRKLQTEAAKYRRFGPISPRPSMANDYLNNPLLLPYVQDALDAQSWFMASATQDEGLNDGIIQYYADAINLMNERGNAQESMTLAAPGIQQLLQRYRIAAPAPSPDPATQ